MDNGHQYTLQFLSRNLSQNMPKNALFFRKKVVKLIAAYTGPRLPFSLLYDL